tara:strand:- start:458 stop:1471 length:1014 start_codon:yes stop_codon:yes gene_type:complete
MKEILDNWNKFVSEQKGRSLEILKGVGDMSVDEALDMFVRYRLDLNTVADDKKWKSLKTKASKMPMKRISDMMRDVVYRTYDSSIAEKSYARYFMANHEATRTLQDGLDVYKEEVLPTIKKIIYSIPIVNIATPNVSRLHAIGAEYVAKRFYEDNIFPGGFFSPGGLSGKPFIGINSYAYLDKSGTLDMDGIKQVFVEELAHAVDGLVSQKYGIDYEFSRQLSRGRIRFSNITKKQKDTDIKRRKFYRYLKDPRETYAKLKRIKVELQGINKDMFFDDEGKIVLRHLERYLQDPRNKDRHKIIRILDLQKIEDIGYVLDQIARVSPENVTQKTSQMA